MHAVSDTYLCTQCGAEYDTPGLCDTCNVELVAEDEQEDAHGFHEEDFSLNEDEENYFRYTDSDDRKEQGVEDSTGDDEDTY